jgi:ribose 1,5-bisphosphokinase PhnN
VLLARLSARGREPEATIRDRLARQVAMAVPPEAAGHFHLDNSGDVAVATERLVEHLNGLA